jgi:uncharacterized membrane protein YidH (DUF202 family)
MMEGALAWMEGTWMGTLVREHPLLFPTLEILHYIALAMVIGTVALLDLRLMGVARRIPVAPLHRLMPWAMGAFGVNLVTGTLFFFSDPFGYYYNVSFRIKVVLLVLVGLNLVLYRALAFSSAERLGPGEDARTGAKLIAGASLVLWVGIIVFGRLIPDLGSVGP